MLIKICGLTRLADAEAAVSSGADMVGFVFVAGTPRAVTARSAQWIRKITGAATVGVFQDAALDEIIAVRDALALDWIQLHGREPEAFIDTLGLRVIRRVDPEAGPVWETVEALAERCLPLLDPGAGGGVNVDWSHLLPAPRGVRFGLAGGLAPANVAEAIRRLRPVLVDVSSGVEAAPGVKDRALVRGFVENARAAASEIGLEEQLESGTVSE